MALGLVGKKIGMTRVYAADGSAVPVTVLEIEPNRVTQVKSLEKDGYAAVQITVGARRADRVGKGMAGHFSKAGVVPGRRLREFRIEGSEGAELKLGAEIKVDIFKAGEHVDVEGVSIGKGFAGTVKRHHFGGGRGSHGASLVERAPGSIGQRQTPGRVFPGKRMAGHLGNVRRTNVNLEVVRVDVDRNLLLVKGAVPGPKGHDVVVRPSVKMRGKKAPAAKK